MGIAIRVTRSLKSLSSSRQSVCHFERSMMGSMRVFLSLVLLIMVQFGMVASAAGRLPDFLDRIGGGSNSGLLPPEKAFAVSAYLEAPSSIRIQWRIAQGYYLYKDKIHLDLSGIPGLALGQFELPRGDAHQDPEFGVVEIFRGDLEFSVPMTGPANPAMEMKLSAQFQGCADRGVCYPPMDRDILLTVQEPDTAEAEKTEAKALSSNSVPAGECSAGRPEGFVETEGLSEECSVAERLQKESWLPVLFSFLGMGLLLSMTPCVFPMLPILSGIILGQGSRLTPARGVLLSGIYVVASALAYMTFGVFAGLFGQNLQAIFQEPWVLATFSGVFVILALSMFGVFELEVPDLIQSRLAVFSRSVRGGTFSGVALMGVLSALIVGPCVAPPLAGALIYIGETGDAVLGAGALFMLGLGMGIPLMIFGASAGRWLPRAGAWMEGVRAIFGVGLLANAIWLLSRVIPGPSSLMLWAALFMVCSVYLGVLDLNASGTGWRLFKKGVGLVSLAYGLILMVGASMGHEDPVYPLRSTSSSVGYSMVADGRAADFRTVRTLAELKGEIESSAREGRPALVDFYADWCIACKEMERDTFSDPRVLSRLSGWRLLRVDVTSNSEQDRLLLREYHLIGPPAVIFHDARGQEIRNLRVIGYSGPDDFLKTIRLSAESP